MWHLNTGDHIDRFDCIFTNKVSWYHDSNWRERHWQVRNMFQYNDDVIEDTLTNNVNDLKRAYFIICVLIWHEWCHKWSKNCIHFRGSWVHPQVLVGFVLLDHKLYVYVLEIVVCPFVLFPLVIVLSVLRFTDSDYLFGMFKLFFEAL